MNKRFISLLGGLTLCLGGVAAVITPEAALHRFNAQSSGKTRALADEAAQLVYTFGCPDGEPALYVFNHSQSGGYMILSADDAAAPLLGYSDSDTFDATAMPPQMKWWIEQYRSQIEYARASNLTPYTPSILSDDGREVVVPLMKTAWNQSDPYNLLTPTIRSKHAPTGCVATALAQIMKYWNYPQRAVGTATITDPSTKKELTMNLDEEVLDWNSMLDSYSGSYTEEEAHAVAFLMKAVGYACATQYGSEASSAFAYTAGEALRDNFGYNPEMQYCSREFFSPAEWDDLIYHEVSSGRPVLYGGQSTSVGHEFVCDGYAGEGYYHFNWGWGGMSDGYFILTALSPDGVGTGGGKGGGYNFGQDAIVGIQPEKERVTPPFLVQLGALTVTTFRSEFLIRIEGEKGLSSWVNTGLTDVTANIGVEFLPMDDSGEPFFVTLKDVSVPKPELVKVDGGLGMNFDGIRGELSVKVPETMKDGKYKVTVVSKYPESDCWVPMLCMPDYYNFFYLEKQGTKLIATTLSEVSVTLDSGEPISGIYYGYQTKMRIEATNNADKEVTAGFYPNLLLNGKVVMKGEGIMLDIPANATVTEEFITTFVLVNGAEEPQESMQYQLNWFDPIKEELYELEEVPVTMHVVSGKPNIKIENFGISGIVPKIVDVIDYGPMNISTVTLSEVDKFEFEVVNKGEYFGVPLYVALFVLGDNRSFMNEQCAPVAIVGLDDRASTYAYMDLSSLEKETIYVALIYYKWDNRMVQVESCIPVYFRLQASSAVDEIETVEDVTVKYYNLQGIEVETPEKGMLLIRRQGSKTSKIIY